MLSYKLKVRHESPFSLSQNNNVGKTAGGRIFQIITTTTTTIIIDNRNVSSLILLFLEALLLNQETLVNPFPLEKGGLQDGLHYVGFAEDTYDYFLNYY